MISVQTINESLEWAWVHLNASNWSKIITDFWFFEILWIQCAIDAGSPNSLPHFSALPLAILLSNLIAITGIRLLSQ